MGVHFEVRFITRCEPLLSKVSKAVKTSTLSYLSLSPVSLSVLLCYWTEGRVEGGLLSDYLNCCDLITYVVACLGADIAISTVVFNRRCWIHSQTFTHKNWLSGNFVRYYLVLNYTQLWLSSTKQQFNCISVRLVLFTYIWKWNLRLITKNKL